MYPLHPEGERPVGEAVPSVGYFFFLAGDFLVCFDCARADAATSFTFFGVLGLLSSLLASCAGFFPVDIVVPALKAAGTD